MKKVFAFLSVFALTLAIIGLAYAGQPAIADDELVPAPGKFLVNPTLEKDSEGNVIEIPMYIMGSIQTTFPVLFDVETAKGTKYEDTLYQAGRNYPWNESKLLVPQYDLGTGNPTGKIYAVYEGGGTTITTIGAGNNFYAWKLKEGVVTTYRISRGTETAQESVENPSCDVIRQNLCGEVIRPAITTLYGSGAAYPISYVIFDGDGKAVSGLPRGEYLAETGSTVMPSIFGFKDGVAVLRSQYDESELDRKVVQVDSNRPLMVDGEQAKDSDGKLLWEQDDVATEFPKLVYGAEYRYVWRYVTEEELAAEKINTAGYLQPGWLADRWDFVEACGPEAKDGYILYAIVGADANYGVITKIQGDVHNASVDALIAAGAENAPAKLEKNVSNAYTYRRAPYTDVVIPVNGISYAFSYLSYTNAQTEELRKLHSQLSYQALLYGREDGYSMQYKAYNLSARDLEFQTAVKNSTSYIQTGAQKVIEVAAGSSFQPVWNLNAAGLLGGFADLNNVYSYKQLSADGLTYKVWVNGAETCNTIDFDTHEFTYETFAELKSDFLHDLYQYLIEHPVIGGVQMWKSGTDTPDAYEDFEKVWGEYLGFGSHSTGAYWLWANAAEPKKGDANFFGQNFDKWIYLLRHYEKIAKAKGNSVYGTAGQYTPTVNFRNLLNGGTGYTPAEILALNIMEADGVNKVSQSPNNCVDSGFVQVLPIEFKDLLIDSTGKPENYTYNIRIRALNSATGKESEITLKYVVVKEFTPILQIQTANTTVPGTTTSFDISTLAKAYDHNYDAENAQILGYDISWKIEYLLPTNLNVSKLVPGKYVIQVSVQNGSRRVTQNVLFTVRDTEAPILYTINEVTVPYGGTFDPRTAIIVAWDNFDGNLLTGNVSHYWLICDTSTVDVYDAGGSYIVTIQVMDAAGNLSSKKNVVVMVGDAGSIDFDEIYEKLDEIKESIGGGTTTDGGFSCAESGAILAGFAAVGALALLVFKKRQ